MTSTLFRYPSQVDAYLEGIDLFRNGYYLVSSLYERDRWFMKLHHRTNGRTIILRWRVGFWALYDGSSVLKSKEYHHEAHSN